METLEPGSRPLSLRPRARGNSLPLTARSTAFSARPSRPRCVRETLVDVDPRITNFTGKAPIRKAWARANPRRKKTQRPPRKNRRRQKQARPPAERLCSGCACTRSGTVGWRKYPSKSRRARGAAVLSRGRLPRWGPVAPTREEGAWRPPRRPALALGPIGTTGVTFFATGNLSAE